MGCGKKTGACTYNAFAGKIPVVCVKLDVRVRAIGANVHGIGPYAS